MTAGELGLDRNLLLGIETGFGQLANLKAEQVELRRVGGLVDDEFALGLGEVRGATHEFRKRLPAPAQSTERVEEQQLLQRLEQRLVVMRPV